MANPETNRQFASDVPRSAFITAEVLSAAVELSENTKEDLKATDPKPGSVHVPDVPRDESGFRTWGGE